jgi:hypothetical protein
MPMRTTVSAWASCGSDALKANAMTSIAVRRAPDTSLNIAANPHDFSMTISYATLCNGCASHRNSSLEIDGCVSCPHSRIKGCRCIN